MSAKFSGNLQSVRLDETPIDPAWLTGLSAAAPAIAAASLLAVGTFLAFFLFTREIQADKVLDHPRRRLLHEVIVQNPGIGFQELLDLTGIGNGAVLHQLAVLQRCGLVVCKRRGRYVHFFDGRADFGDAWRAHAELRNPDSVALLDLLRHNEWASQASLVRLAGGLGWSRGLTQKRLRRLAEAGLVLVRREGTRMLYAARPSPST